jgi:DNA topoisomerase-2
MIPFYKNFWGQIKQVDEFRVITSGVVSLLGENSVEITELPISTWTQAYKESVLEVYLYGSEKDKGKEKFTPLITEYKEYHTDCTVRFVVRMTTEQFSNAEKQGFHKYFKLQKSVSLHSMVLFDQNGCIKRYESALDILKDFYSVRVNFYEKRKAYLEDKLKAESLKLDNIARFIVEKIEGKIKIENLKKKDLINLLIKNNFDSDPIRKWKNSVIERNKALMIETESSVTSEDDSDEKNDFDYLISMPLWNLTNEKKDNILERQKEKQVELNNVSSKTIKQLWIDDLDEFIHEYDSLEKKGS